MRKRFEDMTPAEIDKAAKEAIGCIVGVVVALIWLFGFVVGYLVAK